VPTLFKAIILIVIYSVDVFCSSPAARNDENKNRSVYDIIFLRKEVNFEEILR